MRRKHLVLIPAWNEEDSLPILLDELLAELPDWDVLVIDDGSTDRTVAVASRYPVEVLSLPINMGVGGAIRAGMRFARRNGYEAAVQVDADGQHPPRDVPRLLAELEAGADLVIGARFAGEGSYEAHGVRRTMMWILAKLISPMVHHRLTDPTSGFKACGPRAIALFARSFPQEYLGDTVEALVQAGKAGLVVRQVPVAMRSRVAGEASHSPIKAGLMLVRAMVAMASAASQKRVEIS